jgi:hypothetical protein
VRPKASGDCAVLNVSADTVLRDWRLAKIWLLHEMGGRADTTEEGS